MTAIFRGILTIVSLLVWRLFEKLDEPCHSEDASQIQFTAGHRIVLPRFVRSPRLSSAHVQARRRPDAWISAAIAPKAGQRRSKQALLYRLLLFAFLDALAKLGINPIGLIHCGRRAFRLGIFGRYSRNKRDASIGEPQRSVRASPRLPIIFASRHPTPFCSKLFQIDHAHERILTVDRRSPAAREASRPHVALVLARHESLPDGDKVADWQFDE